MKDQELIRHTQNDTTEFDRQQDLDNAQTKGRVEAYDNIHAILRMVGSTNLTNKEKRESIDEHIRYAEEYHDSGIQRESSWAKLNALKAIRRFI